MKNKLNIINFTEITTHNLTGVNSATALKDKRMEEEKMDAVMDKKELRVNGLVTMEELLNLDSTEARHNGEEDEFLNCDLSDLFDDFIERRRKDLDLSSKER